jgi:hypothetical protein
MDKPVATPAELNSFLFANMVMQQGNMALMFLGQAPHPETNETIRDLEAAKMFVDQLEMLLVKTRGNLDPEEQQLLHQTLTMVRLAYVEEAGKDSGGKTERTEAKKSPPVAEPGAAEPEDENKKKFVKRY